MGDYLVYKYRNSIKIQYGHTGPTGIFTPIGSNSWKSKVPSEYLVKSEWDSKVLVEKVEDIPKAIKLIWGEDCQPDAKDFGPVYMRHRGDSDQTCPYCGANWNWSVGRRQRLHADGKVDIWCGTCENKFTYKQGGEIIYG